MTEQTAEPIAQPEPVSSDTGGLRQLATELEDRREMERAAGLDPAAPAPPPDLPKYPNPTADDIERNAFERNQWRNQWAQQLENERRQDGRSPMDPKSAALLLSALRQTEEQAFAEEGVRQFNETQADAAAA